MLKKMSKLSRGELFRFASDPDGPVLRYSGSGEPGDPSAGSYRIGSEIDPPGVVTSARHCYLPAGDPDVIPVVRD